MNSALVISLIGVIIAMIMMLIAAGRLIWMLSDKLTSIQSDVVMMKEVNSIKLTHLERELAENKLEVSELKSTLAEISKTLYSIKKQNTKD